MMSNDAIPAPDLAHPLSAFTAPAAVLFDRLQLGIRVSLPTVPAGEADAFHRRLIRAGVLDPETRRRGALGRSLGVAFAVPGLAENGRMAIGGELFLAASGPHLTITGRSRIRPDAMRGLRSQLDHPGQPATDGDDNLVWPWADDWQQLLGLQLRNLGQGIDAFIVALAEAAETEPQLLRGAIWVQQCEVCRDFAVADAESLARQLAEQPIQGAGTQIIRPGPRHVGNSVCVAWHEGYANSPERKAYGKRHDLLRIEVALRKRVAVTALLTRAGIRHPASPALTGDAVASALSDVAAVAAPLLDDMQDLVWQMANAPRRSGDEFVLGLAPLVRLAKPEKRQAGITGLSAGPGVARGARLALTSLIEVGRYYAQSGPGMSSSSKVLAALREMVDDGFLASGAGQRRLFVVRPEHNAARQALAAIRSEGGQ